MSDQQPDDEQRRCQRAERCRASEVLIDGDERRRLGAPCDRPLCPACEQAVTEALADAPWLYRDLRNATLVRGRQAPGEKVTRSAGSPMPLNARALHLAEQLAWLLTTWEDEVRSIARLSHPAHSGKREGRQVLDAARLLKAHVSAWLAAPATELEVSRHDEPITQSGADAACALLDWRRRVRLLPGLDADAPKAVRRYDEPCMYCAVRAVTHRAGDDRVHCQSCGAAWDRELYAVKAAAFAEHLKRIGAEDCA